MENGCEDIKVLFNYLDEGIKLIQSRLFQRNS